MLNLVCVCCSEQFTNICITDCSVTSEDSDVLLVVLQQVCAAGTEKGWMRYFDMMEVGASTKR